MIGSQRYVSGLDIGPASIGWACVGLDRRARADTLLCAGVRIFEPGVEGSTFDIESGKDQSKAVAQRTARQRQLFRVLQCAQLLPCEADGSSFEARHCILTTIDMEVEARLRDSNDTSFADLPLYRLPARSLTFALAPHELGRVLFHLSQRRGFKPNCATSARKIGQEEELGQIEKDIGELVELMKETGSRMLGEYFASLDPHTAGTSAQNSNAVTKSHDAA